MNHNAKQRQWSRHPLGDQEPDEPVAVEKTPAPPRPVLPAATGAIVIEVDPEHAGQRLDRALAGLIEARGLSLSRTRIKALIESGNVKLAGVVITDPALKLVAGKTLGVEVPEPVAAEPQGEMIPLDVVYEDEYLLVIDKPAGLVVHPAAGHENGTLVNALIAHCGDSLSGIGGVRRPGIVHRLDKDTSGLLVVAKTDPAHQGLSALFADHGRTMSLQRSYIAFVWGPMERSAGRVEAPIGRHPHHREKQAVVQTESAREAITHWRLEQVFGGKAPVASRIRCDLETGRTHQIRVHMAHISHPVMGDGLYASGFRTKEALLSLDAREALTALGRQALHAAVLGFDHPVTGEPMLFESELPPDLARLDAALTKT